MRELPITADEANLIISDRMWIIDDRCKGLKATPEVVLGVRVGRNNPGQPIVISFGRPTEEVVRLLRDYADHLETEAGLRPRQSEQPSEEPPTTEETT